MWDSPAPQRLGTYTGSLAIPGEAAACTGASVRFKNCAWCRLTTRGLCWGGRGAGEAEDPGALPLPTISALLQGLLRVLSLLRGQRGRKDEDKASRGEVI